MSHLGCKALANACSGTGTEMERRATKLQIAIRVLITSSLALGALDVIAQEGTDDVVAVGPMESIASGGLDFSVLGRSFHAESKVAFAVGEYVAVHGLLKSDGSVGNVWIESLGNYSPGSDVVYEKGVVTEFQPYLGQLRIGGSRLDYTPAMSTEGSADTGLGTVISVSGLQPATNGTVLVDNLMASAEKVRDSLMKGGGVESTLMKGGGVQSSLMKGGGVESTLMKGGGVQSSLMKGGGVESTLMKGGGVQSSLMKGGGVESTLMKGGGVQSSLMKGGGVESTLMKGGGVAGT
jgi:hypothetical protein